MLLGCLLETLLEVSCVIRLFIRHCWRSHVLLVCLLGTLLEVSCVISLFIRDIVGGLMCYYVVY